MESTDALLKGRIHYYGREGYFQAMQNASVEGIKKLGNDPVYRFYSAVSHLLQGHTQEAIRQLQPLQSESSTVGLGVVTALLQAHRRCQHVDQEAVAQLDSKLKEERKKATDVPLYYAGLFLFFANRNDKAREYVERLLKLNASSVDGLTLKGWIEIYAGKDAKSRSINQFFDSVLENKPKHLDAQFGKAKYFETLDMYNEAMEVLNHMVVSIPGFTPPLVEKMKVHLASQDWDLTLDAANRVLSVDSHNLEALKHRIVHGLCRVGPSSDPGPALQDLYRELDRSETNNAALYVQMAQLFSRLCGRSSNVLEETYMMASRAAKVDTGSAEFLTEVGYQCLLMARVKEATKYYRNATKLDESSVAALTGIITCQLLDGQVEMAEQQLDFLKEVQRSLGAAPDILYLSAVLNRLKKGPSERSIDLLNEAIENHYKQLRGQGFGTAYLTALNPDFLLMMVQECLLYAPVQDSLDTGSEPPATSLDAVASTSSSSGGTPGGAPAPGDSHILVKRCAMVLESVSQACPALLPALLLTSKIKMLTGDLRAASSTLTHVIDNMGHTSSEARLLMAQVQLLQGNYKQAQQSLEVGLSFNFEVREQPLYHLIRARVLKKQGAYAEAIKTLKTCLTLSKATTTAAPVSSMALSGGGGSTEMSVSERTSVYLERVDCHLLDKQPDMAAQVMEEARLALKGTGEEVRLTVASADLALNRGDTQQALATLRGVPSENRYYMQARHKMAEIYLNHLHDKRMFAMCYKEMVDNVPSTQNYLVLGDAYMSIQEPDRAIEVYEQAVKRTPRDPDLACRMGRALVKSHQYNRAVTYYKDAIKTGSSNQLRYDMAELVMRMGQHDKAEKTIRQALEIEAQNSDISSMVMQAKLFNLLAKVYERWTGKYEQAIGTLTEAKNVQVKVLKRAQVELPDTLPQQKKLAASMCCKMAEHANNQRDHEAAIKLYKEALDYSPDDSVTLLALARLYLQINNMEMCQKTCTDLLRLDKDNDGATVMMADMSYRRNQYDTAMFHFQQLLERRPSHYPALARLIEVQRRTGVLEEAEIYVSRAQLDTHRNQPGMFFCQGLLDWYTGNPNSALKQFNQARKDSEWGQRAVYNMIEICLNPDNDTLGGETFQSVDEELHRDTSNRDTQDMAIRTADKLLKELRPSVGAQQVSHQVLNGLLLLATKQKNNAEAALQIFMDIASAEPYKDHVGAIFGMATAYMILKQTPRARNQLKRVAKTPWNFEDAEYLERCWLLLADIYVQTGKYDVATSQLKRVLEHNRSSMKAYEYMGFIMEKEQSYRDAAFHYEQAWKFSGNTNPMIGYKLAFNYMKAKRYVDAIDVCHSVLEKHPEYPRIRKEILDKCRGSIRV